MRSDRMSVILAGLVLGGGTPWGLIGCGPTVVAELITDTGAGHDVGSPDRAAAVDAAQVDARPVDAGRVDRTSPDTRAADVYGRDGVARDVGRPDVQGLDANLPDTTAPDTAARDLRALDAAASDVAAPDTADSTQCGPATVLPVDPAPLPALEPAGREETVVGPRFTDDFLYSAAGDIKVGTRREWGSTIIYFGLLDPASNTIDSNDTGREVQIALYDPHRQRQGCAYNSSCVSHPERSCGDSITFLGWNPVQGGSECNRGSGTIASLVEPGLLRAQVQPLQWNPNWEADTCVNNGCDDPGLRDLRTEVLYTQSLRFVHPNIVEVQMQVDNLSDMNHAPTGQEYPTLYATYGANNTPNLNRVFGSSGQEVIIDEPVNDGFFSKAFASSGGWAALQNSELDYGVGIYYENRLTNYRAYQLAGVFNNVRARFSFGLGPHGRVVARAYLLLGGLGTVQTLAQWLDQNLPPFGWLDEPTADAVVGDSMRVRGWALDNKGVTQIEALVDGVVRGSSGLNARRADVCLQYPRYGQCDQVGYDFTVPLADLQPCAHVVEIRASDADGNSRVISRQRVVSE